MSYLIKHNQRSIVLDIGIVSIGSANIIEFKQLHLV